MIEYNNMPFLTQGKTNWKYIIIVLILAVIVGGGILWCLQKCPSYQPPEVKMPEKPEKEATGKECVNDDDCVVFGKTGDCNCGCFNKEYQWESGGECFCLAPTSCKCLNNKCWGVFEGVEEDLHLVIVKSFCDECGGCDVIIEKWGKLVNVKYETKNIDLNNDGSNEIVVEGISCIYEFYSIPIGGVTGNRSFRILQQQDGKWIKIGFISGESYSIEETKTKGYHDIITDSDVGGAGCLREIERYEWDGSYYKRVSSESYDRCGLD